MLQTRSSTFTASIARRDFFRLVLACALLLCIPAVATMFSNEVNWGIGDFIVMGGMLLGTGCGLLYLCRSLQVNSRLVAAGLLLCCFLCVWAELAVGVFLPV